MTLVETDARLSESQRIEVVKPFVLMSLLALFGCTDPTLTTGVVVGTGGVSVYPTLSGKIGGGTVHIQP